MIETAEELMSKKLITIQMDDSIRKAYQLMQERKIRHLPVLDTSNVMVGILSERDVKRAMIPKSGVDAISWEENSIEFDPDHKVSDFMNWPPRFVSGSLSIKEAAEIMLNEKISALVVEGEQKNFHRGIITTDDMLKMLIQLLNKDPSVKNKTIINEFDLLELTS